MQQSLKKGEKVDFALKMAGKVSILIEAKPISMSLGNAQFSQLYRYFAVTESKLAILTNGKEVWFFSDVDEPNKMDKKPLFTFDLQSHDENQVAEFSKFQKEKFSMENILASASNLKYISAAATYIKKQLGNPDDEFIKLVGRQIHEGMLTKSVVEQLRPAIQASLDEVIRDRIRDKLNVAFRPEVVTPEAPLSNSAVDGSTANIVTTDEELMAFMIVKAISARVISVDRVTMRDSKSYCSVFVDDNNRKPVCRFYFNGKSTRHIGLFDTEKNEEKQQIDNLNDIYKFFKKIEDAVKAFA